MKEKTEQIIYDIYFGLIFIALGLAILGMGLVVFQLGYTVITGNF